jgi:hypothetical protein
VEEANMLVKVVAMPLIRGCKEFFFQKIGSCLAGNDLLRRTGKKRRKKIMRLFSNAVEFPRTKNVIMFPRLAAMITLYGII